MKGEPRFAFFSIQIRCVFDCSTGSMFEFVRSHHRLIQIVLALIAVPFAFWGVDSYVRSTDHSREIASVGGQPINQIEFNQALRDQQEQMRSMFGRAFDPDKFDTAESRQALIDQLIDRHLLATETARGNLTITDEELRDTILAIAAFQDAGKFSKERYEQAVRAQGMSPAMFESRLRGDLTLRQLTGAMESSGMLSRTALARWQRINEEEREVEEYVLQPGQFLSDAQVTPDAVKKYYEENKKTFEVPQQVSAEYLALSLDKLAEQTVVSEDDLKAWYDGHQAQYRTPEQRQASHILIGVPKGAPDAERARAKKRAEELLVQVKKNPAGFADLAGRNSQDPGSAAKGGDLGLFSRGMMVKSFDDAAFALKEGEISGVVESDFGFHIIKLARIQPEGGRPFAEVSGEIERELRKQQAQKKFAEIAETFSNLVYEQADSLQPAADRLKLRIQRTTLFSKRNAAEVAPALNNEKLLNALFSDDAIKNKRNTEAVETAPNTLVAARVIEFQPAKIKELAEVEAAIGLILRTREAARLALKRAGEILAELRKGGNADVKWAVPKVVSLQNPQGLVAEALSAVFKADVAKLPAFTMAEVSGSAQAIYRIARINQPQVVDADKRKAREQQLYGTFGQTESDAFLASLREKSTVVVNKESLERKER
jgi:peptidyl-prolyl cis-trans isomerase D